MHQDVYCTEVDPLPRIDVTQATVADIATLAQVEIKARQFPLSDAEIRAMITDKDVYCLKIVLNYKAVGWAAFGVDQDDIHLFRLAIKQSEYLPFLTQALFETITYTPHPPGATVRSPTCHVDWPEHDPDHYVVKQLLSDGWTVTGLEPRMFFGYGEWWDGIKLERTF